MLPEKSKYGIIKGYPRLQRYFGRVMAYIALLRPFTLMAPFIAGFIGVLTPLNQITFVNVETAMYIGVTLALAQGCGQCLNQYADAELDKEIKAYRPIPSGLVTKEEALGFSWLLAIIAVGRSFTIDVTFGGIVLVLIFFAVFYSIAPFSPRKINPVLNMGWMAFSRGFLPMIAVWSIYGSIGRALPYSILAFLWVMGFQATKDVGDVEGDRKFGIKTIPGAYGLRGLIAMMATCTAIYTLISVFFHTYLMLLVLPLAVLAMLTTKKQTQLTENTIAWQCFYLGLAGIYVLMFLIAHCY